MDAARNADRYEDITEQEELKKTLVTKIEKWQESLTVSKRKLQGGTDTWDDLKEKVERLHKQLKKLKIEIQEAENDKSKCHAEHTKYDARLEELESKLAELKIEIQEAENDKSKCHAEHTK